MVYSAQYFFGRLLGLRAQGCFLLGSLVPEWMVIIRTTFTDQADKRMNGPKKLNSFGCIVAWLHWDPLRAWIKACWVGMRRLYAGMQGTERQVSKLSQEVE
jgi:hypothetical protein